MHQQHLGLVLDNFRCFLYIQRAICFYVNMFYSVVILEALLTLNSFSYQRSHTIDLALALGQILVVARIYCQHFCQSSTKGIYEHHELNTSDKHRIYSHVYKTWARQLMQFSITLHIMHVRQTTILPVVRLIHTKLKVQLSTFSQNSANHDMLYSTC